MFELERGHIKLSSTESKLSRITNPHFRKWRRLPLASASFEVGPAPAIVLQPNDELSFHREATGDLALTVVRNESLILALGAVTHFPLGREIQVEERLKEGDRGLAWIDYLSQMPRECPKDLYLSFTTQDERINLCEGDEAYLGDYYVRVERIFRRLPPPGELSMLAIARLSDSLTKQMVIESAKAIMIRARPHQIG